MGKGLTFSIIFEAQSLNYGEGIGNISELKKLTRGDGRVYTYSSRQSIRYDIVRLGHEMFGWNLDVLTPEQGTIQYKKDKTIEDSVEMDLFGYMKTAGKQKANTRSAVVRLTHAISLEPYRGDMDFLSNKGFADRLGRNPDLANIETHYSFYTYTLTADLDKVGIDGEIKLNNTERYERMDQLLEVIKILSREIRGRVENLSPLFIVGGVYEYSNPYFMGRIKLEFDGENPKIDIKPIKSTLETSVNSRLIKDDTYAGIVDGIFSNKDELMEILGDDRVLTIDEFFKKIKEKIKDYYGV